MERSILSQRKNRTCCLKSFKLYWAKKHSSSCIVFFSANNNVTSLFHSKPAGVNTHSTSTSISYVLIHLLYRCNYLFSALSSGLGVLYHDFRIVLSKSNYKRITGNKLSINRITPAKPKASEIYFRNTKNVPSRIYNQEETFLLLYLICTIWVVPIIFRKFRHTIGNGSNQPVLSYSETPLL